MIKLKLKLSVLFCLLIASSCQSQIELTKEFDTNEYICSHHHFDGVNLYATFDTDNNEIKIYNSNHQIQSRIIYDPENQYNSLLIYGLSKDVFNSDNNIEFLIQKINSNGDLPNMVLMNDENTILQEFSNYAGFRTIGNQIYIVESKTETEYDQETQKAQMEKTDKLYLIKGKFRKLIF